MTRVVLPDALRRLAGVSGEVELAVESPVTIDSILTALEKVHPVLRGAVRDRHTHERRAFVRFFVCGQDWSHEAGDRPLPDAISSGDEPFLVIGAMAGG